MHKKLPFLIGGVILILAILYIPVQQKRVISYGVDTYATHRPLYGEKTTRQAITTENTLLGLGAILVNLRRSAHIPEVTVTITNNETGETLVSQNIPKEAIQDDQFAYAPFPDTPLAKNQSLTIQLSAPEATNQNPIGLRFGPKDDTAAIALIERVPLWKYIHTNIQNRINSWRHISFAIALSLVCASVAFLPRTKKSYGALLVIIVVAAFTVQAIVVPRFGGVSGGDPYNYLSTSRSITEGKNPFANTKRLPGYPLILAPFYASGIFDDQHVMRYSQVVASMWGIIMIACIARALKLSWPTALAASAILAFQKDYFYTSLRPEPYTLYTALLLTSLFLFLRSYETNKLWVRILFGVALGYGAMVRQEGFMCAAVLGACSVAYEAYVMYTTKSWKPSLQRFASMYTLAFVLVLPFFIHNAVTYGHPLYTEYFEGDRLQIVDSYLAFEDAVGATWGVLGSMWKTSWESLERVSLTTPLFISSAILLWAWYALLRRYKQTPYITFVVLATSLVWVFLIFSSIYTRSPFTIHMTVISAAWILAAIPLFLFETRWKGAVVFLVLISQILIATWFHPFPKHYQQSYPLIVLMIATAFVSQAPVNKKIATATIVAATTLPFCIIAVFLAGKMNAELDRYNANVALDSVTYRATRLARTLPAPVGFDQAHLPARVYFDPNAIFFPDEDKPTPAMESEWLTNNHIKTMVVSNGNNVFKNIPPDWKKIKDFKAEGRKNEIVVGTVYSLP